MDSIHAVERFAEQFFPRATDQISSESIFWKNVIETVEDPAKNTKEHIDIIKAKIGAFVKKSRPILFVFDEARKLTDTETTLPFSAFRVIRRAAAHADLKSYICVCYVDTSAKVANFAPSDTFDPSERKNVPNSSLFPPFIAISSCDSYALSESEKLPQTGDLYKWIRDRDVCPVQLLKFGRPLWFTQYNAYLDSASSNIESSALTNVLEFAALKLFRSVTDQEDTEKMGSLRLDAGLLSLISVRMPLSLIPVGKLPELMIAANMAFCQYISTDRNSIFTTYLSEPILAAASARLIRSAGARQFVSTLSKNLAYSRVDAGHFGEVVAAMIVLGAYDHVACGKTFQCLESISVREFINAMFGQNAQSKKRKYFDDDESIPSFPNAVVAFNHFIRFREDLDVTLLGKGLERMFAFWGRHNHEAIDFCIPMMHESSERPSAILVQVKNHADSFSSNETTTFFKKMIKYARRMFGNTGEETRCIYIVQALGQGSPKTEWSSGLIEGCHCILALGFDLSLYPNILGLSQNPSQITTLRGLLFGDGDIYTNVMQKDEPTEASGPEYAKAVMSALTVSSFSDTFQEQIEEDFEDSDIDDIAHMQIDETAVTSNFGKAVMSAVTMTSFSDTRRGKEIHGTEKIEKDLDEANISDITSTSTMSRRGAKLNQRATRGRGRPRGRK